MITSNLIFILMIFTACKNQSYMAGQNVTSNTKEDSNKIGQSSNVTKVESDPVKTFNGGSEIAGSSVSIGKSDADAGVVITLEKGLNIGKDVKTKTGDDQDWESTGQSVVVSSNQTDLQQPMTISLPLPTEEGIGLTQSTFYGIIYLGDNEATIYGTDETIIDDGKATIQSYSRGTYMLITSSLVIASKSSDTNPPVVINEPSTPKKTRTIEIFSAKDDTKDKLDTCLVELIVNGISVGGIREAKICNKGSHDLGRNIEIPWAEGTCNSLNFGFEVKEDDEEPIYYRTFGDGDTNLGWMLFRKDISLDLLSRAMFKSEFKNKLKNKATLYIGTDDRLNNSKFNYIDLSIAITGIPKGNFEIAATTLTAYSKPKPTDSDKSKYKGQSIKCN